MTTPASPPGKSGTGLDPKLAATIAYLGGAVSGIILLILEKEDRFVRFHAMQSTITFLAVFVLHLVLAGTPVIGWLLYFPFIVAIVGLWVFLMFKAFKGQLYKLPYIGEWADQHLK